MSWDGRNFEKPLILVDCINLQEAVSKNKFEKKGVFREQFSDTLSTEDIFVSLQKERLFGDSCKYLAYTNHKRDGIWWAYQCIVQTKKAIDKAKQIALEEGSAKKKKLVNLSSYHDPKLEEAIKKQKKDLADTMQKHEELVKKLDLNYLIENPYTPKNEIQKQFLESVDLKGFYDARKKIQGVINDLDPQEKVQYLRMKQNILDEYQKSNGGVSLQDQMKKTLTLPTPHQSSHPDSLLDKAATRLKMKHDNIKKEIDKEMKQIFPLKLSGLPEPTPKADIESALKSVHDWIIAPTDINAINVFNAGNKAADSMEGMLALSAFWAHGNLSLASPEKTSEVVLAPAGLVSEGIDSVLLMAAMAEDLDKSSDEMYEIYYKIGIESAQGIKLWDAEFLRSIKQTTPNVNSRSGFGRTYAKPE